MADGGRAAVRVVIINTQYVETDARSFKSVVQKLTGKDAKVTNITAATSSRSCEVERQDGFRKSESQVASLKEFERLLKEMPPLEELYGLWGDDY